MCSSKNKINTVGNLKTLFEAALLYHILFSIFYSIMWAIFSFRIQILRKLWPLKLPGWLPSIGIGNKRMFPLGYVTTIDMWHRHYELVVNTLIITIIDDQNSDLGGNRTRVPISTSNDSTITPLGPTRLAVVTYPRDCRLIFTADKLPSPWKSERP